MQFCWIAHFPGVPYHRRLLPQIVYAHTYLCIYTHIGGATGVPWFGRRRRRYSKTQLATGDWTGEAAIPVEDAIAQPDGADANALECAVPTEDANAPEYAKALEDAFLGEDVIPTGVAAREFLRRRCLGAEAIPGEDAMPGEGAIPREDAIAPEGAIPREGVIPCEDAIPGEDAISGRRRYSR